MKKVTALICLLIMVMVACAPAVTPAPAATPEPAIPVVRPTTVSPTQPGSSVAPAGDPLSTGGPVTVDIGGRSLTIRCFGAGSPVVVLESAINVPWTVWKSIYTAMPRDVRVCMYDRSTQSHTSQEYVTDLHALLAGAGLEGPYILVGDTFGGMNAILYASQYPKDVAGIVLENSEHPDEIARWLAALPPEASIDSPDLKALRNLFSSPQHNYHGVDFTASLEQVSAVKSLGDIPLIVLTPLPPADWGDVPQDVQAELDQLTQAMQEELAGLSSHGRREFADSTYPGIHIKQPQLVIDAILELVKAARGQ
jgi:pimeloyl-ACP methyl ester carboxylesterase